MKKIFFILLLFFLGCKNYQPNYQINKRTEPIIIIAIDTTIDAVIMRDGDNNVFTIYNNATTKAITSSLVVGDTLRIDEKTRKIISKNF